MTQPDPPSLSSVAADDLPPSARAMITLLSASLERQARIAEQNNDRVAALGDRVDAMGEKVSSEIGAAMRYQTKVIGALVGLAIMLLGGAAGVGFMGEGYGVTVSTKEAMEAAAIEDEPIIVEGFDDTVMEPDLEGPMGEVVDDATEATVSMSGGDSQIME